MIQNPMSRRAVIASLAALGVLPFTPAIATGTTAGPTANPVVHVAKDPNCGCCMDWVAVLEQNGFAVTVEDMDADALQGFKTAQAIPDEMRSCHTGVVEGYALEGHVPAQDIRRLLAERPDAVGLAVPGMPYGSPGMGPESERDAYRVYLILKDGTSEIFAEYAAA